MSEFEYILQTVLGPCFNNPLRIYQDKEPTIIIIKR